MRHLEQRFERKSKKETEESQAELLNCRFISRSAAKLYNHDNKMPDTEKLCGPAIIMFILNISNDDYLLKQENI